MKSIKIKTKAFPGVEKDLCVAIQHILEIPTSENSSQLSHREHQNFCYLDTRKADQTSS